MGFSREQVNILGVIKLRTTFGTKPNINTIDVRYFVINSQASYHMIPGRPFLNTLGAKVSTPYLALKFLISATEVGIIHVNQQEVQ